MHPRRDDVVGSIPEMAHKPVLEPWWEMHILPYSEEPFIPNFR